ncbi:MAG: hypothetical protein K2P74_06895 [Nitrosomonas sp.]|nr:hypothetical protein [Nitrosomonas sp.]
MNCADFFSSQVENKEKCKALQKISECILVKWENESASLYSPGPVENDEILYRQIISPIHYEEETNTLTPGAFNDVSDKGLSVDRARYSTKDQIDENANLRAQKHNIVNPSKKTRSYIGIINFACNDVRGIIVKENAESPDRRGFGVYDTASSDNQSHADICQIVNSKALGRSARSKIRDLANEFLLSNPFVT